MPPTHGRSDLRGAECSRDSGQMPEAQWNHEMDVSSYTVLKHQIIQGFKSQLHKEWSVWKDHENG